MWGGRFATPPSEALAALNNSLPVDRRLWAHDIRGSKAWVAALGDAGVLDSHETASLLEGLDRVHRRLAGGDAAEADDEDIHTLVERLLYEEVGALAGKLHTGRSRNDQVATDLRLWCLDAIDALDGQVAALGSALAVQARNGLDMLLPGYTHGQQAQPVRWGYVLAAHARPLVRDRERLAEARRRVSELPLGSGALAGSGVAVDREQLREALGFRAVSSNALDATGDRDFVAELLFAITLLATHVSRLGGELVTYSSTEYGFVRLSDAFSTGSSLLPQKRNPDVFELARAKAARTLGDLVAMLGTMRGLPAGYSKDLQEDKAVLFEAVDTMLVTLPAVRGAVETLEPVPERMQSALRETLLATDVADELVDEGVPFRDAHGLAGRLVQAAETLGIPLRDVPPDRAAGIHGSLPDVLVRLGSFEDSVERRRTVGGTSRASVVVQLDDLEREFGAA
jgi:argininosuccinate lyase